MVLSDPGGPPGGRHAQLVERLHAAALPGDGAPPAGAAHPQPRPAAAPPRRAAAAEPRPPRRAQPPAPASAPRRGRPGGAHRAATSWPPRCRPPRRRRSTSRASRRRSSGCTAWTRTATREYGTRCLIARRLVERGVRFVQLFLGGQPWDTHNTIQQDAARDLPAHRPAGRGAGEGPEAARPARHDARPLGRRDRPAAGRARATSNDTRRPRPQRPGLLDLAGRRRHQGRHDLRRHRRGRPPGRR